MRHLPIPFAHNRFSGIKATASRIDPQTTLGILISILAGVLIFATYFVILKRSAPNLLSDSYEYAQVARNIAQGRGLVTNTATVLEYWLLGRGGLPVPYFFHDIGNPLLLSMFFKVFGPSDKLVAWSSGLFYVFTLPLTYLLALRVFNRQVALIAALLVAINPEMIVFSVTGYSEVPYAFFFTLLILLLYAQKTGWMAFLGGLTFGWLTILRSNSLPLLPWFLLFILIDPPEKGSTREEEPARFHLPKSTAARGGLFLVGFALLFAPIAARNYYWLHNPLYNVNSIYSLVWYTSAISGKSSSVFEMPGLNVEPIQFIIQHPSELVNKAQYQLGRTFPQLLMGGVAYNGNWADAIIIFLFLVSILVHNPQETPSQKYLRWLIIALILSALFFGALFNIRWRHLYGFIPLVSMFVAELLFRLHQLPGVTSQKNDGRFSTMRIAGSYAGILAILLGLGFGPLQSNLNDPNLHQLTVYYRGMSAFLEKNTPPTAVILTNGSSGVLQLQNSLAWYTGRQFVESHSYTNAALTALPLESPLFMLFIPDDSQSTKSALGASTVDGFTMVATWRDERSRVKAVLFKRQ